MSLNLPLPPTKGVHKNLRPWLLQLRSAILGSQLIQGANVTVSAEDNKGTLVSADRRGLSGGVTPVPCAGPNCPPNVSVQFDDIISDCPCFHNPDDANSAKFADPDLNGYPGQGINGGPFQMFHLQAGLSDCAWRAGLLTSTTLHLFFNGYENTTCTDPGTFGGIFPSLDGGHTPDPDGYGFCFVGRFSGRWYAMWFGSVFGAINAAPMFFYGWADGTPPSPIVIPNACFCSDFEAMRFDDPFWRYSFEDCTDPGYPPQYMTGMGHDGTATITFP